MSKEYVLSDEERKLIIGALAVFKTEYQILGNLSKDRENEIDRLKWIIAGSKVTVEYEGDD